MIIDTEINRGNNGHLKGLKVSYYNKEGDVAFAELPLNQSRDGYVWEYCNPNDKAHEKFLSWDEKPVKRVSTSRINKYRIEEIIMERADEIPEIFEYNIPKKYTIDIETEITDGFPDPEFANNKVTAIAICNCTDKRITVLAIKELKMSDVDKITDDINKHFSKYKDTWQFNYVAFESEYDMLYTFFGKLMKKMPCITGWNVLGFDWKYLVNRADRLRIDPSMCSPSGYLHGRDRLPQHKLIVDYLDIVKKWDRVIKIKDNYKLDYIGERSTGISKIKYPGTLKDLYDKDFVKFVFYNAVDAILVHYIDQELDTMSTFFKIASITKVEINRVFSPVWVQEALMTREFKLRDRVIVNMDKDGIEQKKFDGAYVMHPIKGLHEWVCCFDFASLYPTIMRQFNISPENYLGDHRPDMDEDVIVTASGKAFDNKKDSVLKTILTNLYGHRKVVKGKMMEINKEIDYLEKTLK